jgi:hypothetical protein
MESGFAQDMNTRKFMAECGTGLEIPFPLRYLLPINETSVADIHVSIVAVPI